jgi:D-tyrosyl-tRNA(Tyr) deacylase
MRIVVQRVKKSSVSVDGNIIGSIGKGLNVLLGVTHEDTEKDADYLVEKLLGLRIFTDSEDKMNLSISDLQSSGVETGVLCISQFTLFGDCRKGKRPAFVQAAAPDMANELYEYFLKQLREKSVPGTRIEKGEFGADMTVEITNDGPVTILIDSTKLF